MSSLIPERCITILPSLAATIGLEEAVMLQLMDETSRFQATGPSQLDSQQLREWLPFWNEHDIQRITKSLVDKGVILLDSPPYSQSGLIIFRFNEASSASAPVATVNQAPPAHAGSTNAVRDTRANPFSNSANTGNSPRRAQGANRIAPNWQPDSSVLTQLQQHDIPSSFIFAQLPEFITYWQDRGEVSWSWGAKFLKHVLRAWRHHQAQTPFVDQSTQVDTPMAKGWYPSTDACEILTRTGISQGFIEDAVAEFVLYWQERGDSTRTWNSKFIRHVKQQWARYTRSLKHDMEPRPIPDDWQPDNDVFDILQMANIDLAFSQTLVPEFVMYWRDSKQLHTSWNTKFLQHVKYHWAKQHQFNAGNAHAGQQAIDPSGHRAATGSGFIEKHTDRSWADGL